VSDRDARIFVQIAAYRDPELVPTLRDCVAQASHPERLRFGICWQHGPDENLAEFADDSRLRVMAVPFERGRGACWARQQTQRLYGGETYTLQLDSHHRFVTGWDSLLVDMLEGLRADGYALPILTSYAPVYEPLRDPEGRGGVPLRLHFDGFRHDGPFAVMPHAMDGFETLDRPEPARFFSGHFAFTLGRFCLDVPYDPKLYFFGEEPAMAIRAYTHGYDLFHPHRLVLWHHYGRGNSPKHWGDNNRWMLRNELSMRRFRSLVGLDTEGSGAVVDLAGFGLGSKRSIDDFQRHTGISFRLRGATAHAERGGIPPEPQPPRDLADLDRQIVRRRSVTIPIGPTLADEPRDGIVFLYVGAHSHYGEELIRVDLREDQLATALAEASYLLEFNAAAAPAEWTLWVYRDDTGWGRKVSGRVD